MIDFIWKADELFPFCICNPEYVRKSGKHVDTSEGTCEKNFVPRVAQALSEAYEKGYSDATEMTEGSA